MIQKLIFIPFVSRQSNFGNDKHVTSTLSELLNDSNYTFPSNQIVNPVLFISNGIGDGFLALPAIRCLANYYWGRLTVIYDSFITPWWLYDLPLKQIVLIEVIRENSILDFDYIAVAREIKKCDLFISFNYGQLQCIRDLCKLLNPSFSFGFDPFFDILLQQSAMRHASNIYFDVIQLITKTEKIKKYCYPPSLLFSTLQVAEKLFNCLNIDPRQSLIFAIHTDTQPDKMWDANNWQILLRNLLIYFPMSCIFILGTAYEFSIQDKRIIDLTGLPFDLSVAMLRYCHVFVGIDSCLLHVADLLGLIGIGLFLSSSSEVYGFRYSKYYINLVNLFTPESILESIQDLLRLSKS